MEVGDIGGAREDTASEKKKWDEEGESGAGCWRLVRATGYDQQSDEKDNTEHAKDTCCSESAVSTLIYREVEKRQEQHGTSCTAKKYWNG